MIFPISDDDGHLVSPAWVTIVFIAANVALFLYQFTHPDFTYGWSVIPKEITTGEDLVGPIPISVGGQQAPITHFPGPGLIHFTILSAMFMHGGWAHLGGNMLFLWIFGDNVEHRFGAVRFLVFYLISGIVATFAQIAVDPDSIIPNLGASGAVSGVLGAYIVLFPKNRVNAVVFFRMVSVPAVLAIGLWAVMQFVSGYGSIVQAEQTGGVAYAAHIGGFLAGVVTGIAARFLMKEEPQGREYEAYTYRPRRR